MLMNEYVNKVFEALPEPTTVKQGLMDKMIDDIMVGLTSKGQGYCFRGRDDGNKELLLSVGKRVMNISKDKGYKVRFDTWAESNSNKFFELIVEVPT